MPENLCISNIKIYARVLRKEVAFEALVVGELKGAAEGGGVDCTRKILTKKETEHYED